MNKELQKAVIEYKKIAKRSNERLDKVINDLNDIFFKLEMKLERA